MYDAYIMSIAILHWPQRPFSNLFGRDQIHKKKLNLKKKKYSLIIIWCTKLVLNCSYKWIDSDSLNKNWCHWFVYIKKNVFNLPISMIFAHLRHFYVLFHDPLANNARKFKSVLNLYLEIILTTMFDVEKFQSWRCC